MKFSTLQAIFRNALIISALVLLTACSGSSSDAPQANLPPAPPPAPLCTPQAVNANVSVSWSANRDTGVNQAGGGYRVYHSTNSGFNVGDTGVSMIDVPYVAAPSAPTTADVNVSQTCLHYFRVQAYSTLNNAGGPLSDQLVVSIPNP